VRISAWKERFGFIWSGIVAGMEGYRLLGI
jgi:hypothetical protein